MELLRRFTPRNDNRAALAGAMEVASLRSQ